MIAFRVVCSWCQQVMVTGTAGAPISHSICAACSAVYFPELA